jgi:putative sigma-54 modulation protein
MTKAVDLMEGGPAYNIAVVGRNVQVTEPMKQYAIDKVHKMDRISDRIIDVAVTMDIQKVENRVSIMMSVGHTKIKVTAIEEEMYAAIDKAVDKLQQKLRKYRGRIREHQAKALHVVDMNVNILKASDPTEEVNEAIDEENKKGSLDEWKAHEISRKVTMPLKTLSYNEAVMKMDLSDDSFQVFRSEEDQKIKIIYRLEDGDYGVIEPE